MKLFLSYSPLFLILFLFAGHHAAAQDDATTKFIDSIKKSQALVQDSAVVITDTTVSKVESQPDSTDDTTDYAPTIDTAIVSRLRPINADSIRLIKKDKGFYYQQYIDSLLRAGETGVKDTKDDKIDLSALSTFFTVFKIILWVLAICILLFVIYRLFLGRNALFMSNRKNIESVIELTEEKPSADQYDQLIKKAEGNNDFRLAVRYRYLQTLYRLSEKEFIQYGTEKTNYQYITEVRKRSTKAAGLFAALSLKYEYCWYGEYPVNNSMYASMLRDFTDFNNETA